MLIKCVFDLELYFIWCRLALGSAIYQNSPKDQIKLPVCASESEFAGLVACQHTIYLSIKIWVFVI